MIIAERSPALNSESSRARANGRATSLKSEYVSRVFSRSRSASIRQISLGQRSSASRKAPPRQLYWSRLSIKNLFHVSREKHVSRYQKTENRELTSEYWFSYSPERSQKTSPDTRLEFCLLTTAPECAQPAYGSPTRPATRNPAVRCESDSPIVSVDQAPAGCRSPA